MENNNKYGIAVVLGVAVICAIVGGTITGAAWYSLSRGKGQKVATCPNLEMAFKSEDMRDVGGDYSELTSERMLEIKTATGEQFQLDRGEPGWISQGPALADQFTSRIYLRTNGTQTEVFFMDYSNDMEYAGTIDSDSFAYVAGKTNCKIWKNVWSMN